MTTFRATAKLICDSYASDRNAMNVKWITVNQSAEFGKFQIQHVAQNALLSSI